MKSVANFEINYQQLLNSNGDLNPGAVLPDWATPEHLKKVYNYLWLTRRADKKAIALQRTGLLGTYPSIEGQEAVFVGLAAAMQDNDIFVPYYRDIGAHLWRGVNIYEIFQFWGGDEFGSQWQDKVAKHDFPICVPIASQTLHAVGIASAIKIKKQKNAVVVTIGDGGTSRGDFYEAMNVAGVWNLPVVFVINNNHWAISVPLEKQTHAQTLAQKSIAAGIPCLQVDGDDVLAVQDAVKNALQLAYQGQGPFVIEAISYRMGDHTTADDASRYRPSAELEKHKQEDPLVRFEKFLLNKNIITPEYIAELETTQQKQVEQQVEIYKNLKKQPKTTMFDYLYAKLPEPLMDQYHELEGQA